MSAILVAALPAASLRRNHPVEVQYEPDGPGSGTLAVQYRGAWAVYRVEEVGADAGFVGRCFRVTKTDGDVYTVQLHKRDATKHLCDCADGVFKAARRGTPCKHAAALELARDRGLIDCEAPDDHDADPREADWLDDAARDYADRAEGGVS